MRLPQRTPGAARGAAAPGAAARASSGTGPASASRSVMASRSAMYDGSPTSGRGDVAGRVVVCRVRERRHEGEPELAPCLRWSAAPAAARSRPSRDPRPGMRAGAAGSAVPSAPRTRYDDDSAPTCSTSTRSALGSSVFRSARRPRAAGRATRRRAATQQVTQSRRARVGRPGPGVERGDRQHAIRLAADSAAPAADRLAADVQRMRPSPVASRQR